MVRPVNPQEREKAASGGCPDERALHKATARLASSYETIVCEDLNVARMIRNQYLARAVADQGFATALLIDSQRSDRDGRYL